MADSRNPAVGRPNRVALVPHRAPKATDLKVIGLRLAMSLVAQPHLDESWLLTARDAAFPLDGARCSGGAVHDPSICRFGGQYLMITTSGHEFVPLSLSRDLTSWSAKGPIMSAKPGWLKEAIPGHNSIWAPAPLVLGQKLRIYYCASARFGQNTSYIGMAECENFDPEHPQKGWVDKGKLIESTQGESNFNAIDPDVLVDRDGRHWMVYGSYWSGMYQVELHPTTGLLKDPSSAPRHVASNTADKGNPLEAPAMFQHGGYYYLGVTYGLAAQGIRSTYRMVVGRSKTPDGPFLGYDDKPMTEGGSTSLLKSSEPMFGPGGGNYFVGEGGQLYMAFHYYDARLFWHGDLWGAPQLQIRKVMWGADGWPLPGLPAGAALKQQDHLDGEWDFQVDFGRVETLVVKDDFSMTLGDRKGTWKRTGDQLEFRWPKAEGGGEWIDQLVLDASNGYFVGRNQSGVVIRGIKRQALPSR